MNSSRTLRQKRIVMVVVTLLAFVMAAGAMAQRAAAATPFLDDWNTLSGRSFVGTPAVISRATSETEAFVSGVDSTVWHVRYDERRWQDWEGMGAPPTPSGVGIVGSPGAVSTFTGLADVFVRTSNNRIWAKAYASAHWSDWYVLPAPPSNLTLVSDPVVISTEPGRIELFVRGADGHVWYIAYGEGHWYGWADIGAPAGGTVADAPTVISSERGRIQVFTRSASGRVSYIAFGENQWYGWYDLGQPAGVSVASAPAVISSEPGRLQAFVRGADNHVWYIAYGESRWYGWYDLAGDVRGTPSVVASDTTHIHVFARYANNDLFYRQWSNNTWNWWQNLGPSPNGTMTGSPVAVSSDPSHFQIFSRASTGHLAAIMFNGTWQPWSDLGADVGPLKPAFVSSGAGRLEAFVRGQDNTVWLDRYQGSRWIGWEGMGAPTLPSGVGIVGSAGAVSTSAGLDDVFVRTSDNRIWAKAYASAHWSDWYVLPAPPSNLTLASDPVVISSESGRIQLFVRGADGHVWYIAYGEGHWYGWYDVGQPTAGAVVGVPEVISSEPGRIQVFIRGTDGHAWYISYGESHWYGWYDLGGQIQGTPSAVASDATHIWAFARDQSNNLVYRAWANATWGTWQSLGASPTGSLTGPPQAVSTEAGRVQVFARGQNSSLLFRAFGEGQWYGWVNLGNQLGVDPVPATWAGVGRSVHVAAIDSNNDFAHVGIDQTPPTITASGDLYAARNEPSLTSGALSVHADDDYSGVDSITLYERDSAGVRTRISGDSRACLSKGCETTADDWSYTLNPVALSWQTGVHHLTVEAADRAGNVSQSVNWDVAYYPTSWGYGGTNHVVDTDADAALLGAALATRPDYSALWNNLTSTEKNYMMESEDPSWVSWAPRIDALAPTAVPSISVDTYDGPSRTADFSWEEGADPDLGDGIAGSQVDILRSTYRWKRVGASWSTWKNTDEFGFTLPNMDVGDTVTIEVGEFDRAGNASASTSRTFTIPSQSRAQTRVAAAAAVPLILECAAFCEGLAVVGAGYGVYHFTKIGLHWWDGFHAASESDIDSVPATDESAAQKSYDDAAKTNRNNGRKALKEAGRIRAEEEAHHVIAVGSRKAAYAREVARRCGLDLNGLDNMVGLDRRFHRRVHTNGYYRAVDALMAQFDPRRNLNPGCIPSEFGEGLFQALRDFAERLKSGNLPG